MGTFISPFNVLQKACVVGKFEEVKLLLDKGVPLDMANGDGKTALMLACGEGHVEIARLLVDKGANLEAQDQNGATALMLACIEGDVETAQLLVEKGANLDAQNKDGVTLLMMACERNGNVETARLLVEKGLDVQAQTKDGSTSLMYACSNGHVETVRLLLEMGATPWPGITGLARNVGGVKMEQLVLALRTAPAVRADAGRTLLAAALAPEVFWSSNDDHKISLWKRCALNATTSDNCLPFDQPQESDVHSVHKELRDGAISGCVFAALTSIVASLMTCCKLKKWTVFTNLLAAISATATIGCWVQFMQHQSKNWNISPAEAYKTADAGLALAATGMVTAYMGFVASWCVPGADKYENLA